MLPANRVINHLRREKTPFELLSHAPCSSLTEAAERSGVQLEQVARAVVLHSKRRLLMAILPANALIDFDAIAQLTGERMKPVPGKAIRPLFKDCEPGSIPPLGGLYGLKVIVDEALLLAEHVYFEPGSHRHLVKLARSAFIQLHTHAERGVIARPRQALAAREGSDFVHPANLSNDLRFTALRPIAGLKERIQSLRELPSMPSMAGRLLQLLNSDHPDIAQLAEIIQDDPSLSAQVLRLARSPWYAYQGELETIEQAITRVLGFDQTINMALGIATGRSFSISREGPLGLDAFWQHAIYSANLSQTIARALPVSMAISPAVAYLSGLLHNIGFLLMGQMLQPEYYLLNRIVEANPEVPITLIEKRLLVVTHSQIGAWLMKSWNMPPALTVAVREHHNEYYQGEHSYYAKLVLLSDHLLRRHEIGDGNSPELPQNLLMALGLSETTLESLMATFIEQAAELQQMARQMAA